ncbi:glycosyltransferase [Verrucomicrobiaceae bacterium 227]
MKLIINTTTLVLGGALQVALSFLNELKIFGQDDYHVFLSAQVEAQLEKESFPANFTFYSFEQSPASLLHRWSVVKRLKQLEETIEPDVVFTVFGPSYWRPKAKHLSGFALPHIVYSDGIYVQKLPFKIHLKALIYQKWEHKRCADYYVTETEDVSNRLASKICIPEERVFTVGNTCGSSFFDTIKDRFDVVESAYPKAFKFVTISANHKHKNLGFIAEVIKELDVINISCVFYVTLNPADYEQLFSHAGDRVINLGPVDVKYCPSIYSQCDALFLPTFLECFTASYAEAMAMNKPIITSDLGFARTVCDNAALYCDPVNAKSTAQQISNLVSDKSQYNDLIQKGRNRLATFPTAAERARKYVDILKEIMKKGK